MKPHFTANGTLAVLAQLRELWVDVAWKEGKHSSWDGGCSISSCAALRRVWFLFLWCYWYWWAYQSGRNNRASCGLSAATFGFQLKSGPWVLATAESRSPSEWLCDKGEHR